MNRQSLRQRSFRVALGLLGASFLALSFTGCGREPEPTASSEEAAKGERQIAFYRHPMNPSVTSPVPAKDEMGMDYVPVYEDETNGSTNAVAGLSTVRASESGIRLAGVRTAVATRELVARTTRTVGLVVPDERRVRHVHTKIGGWVEKLHVNYTGQPVRAGQPILAIYSPELLASQEEYVRAREAAARFAGSSIPEVRRGGDDLVAAARRRLELLDVPGNVIASLDRGGKPQRAVTLVAPAAGVVTAKTVLEGMEVQPGMDLFTLTDLSTVWVEADFYELEAKLLRVGQPVEVQLPFDAGHVMRGEVTFIYPTLSPDSRTLRARVELANADGHLKPGMYVDVTSGFEPIAGVSVPDDAIIDSGLRQVVFVETAPGTFEPREVRATTRGQGRAAVASGLREGERVATRANFLLDSESRLRAALQGVPVPAAPAATSTPQASQGAAHQH